MTPTVIDAPTNNPTSQPTTKRQETVALPPVILNSFQDLSPPMQRTQLTTHRQPDIPSNNQNTVILNSACPEGIGDSGSMPKRQQLRLPQKIT
jgi:hypothetical protein